MVFLQNNLILNMSKTSLINCSRVNSILPLVIDVYIISQTNSVKNLDFIVDIKLSFIDLIASVCQSSQLKNSDSYDDFILGIGFKLENRFL